MKKVLLYLMLGFVTLSLHAQTTVNATSFSISTSSLTYTGTVDSFELVAQIKISNLTANPVNVIFSRHIVKNLTGTVNFFCVASGVCYDSSTYIGPTPLTVKKASPDTLLGDYEPNGLAGTTKIRYHFYNQANLSDSASLLITFTTISLAGI